MTRGVSRRLPCWTATYGDEHAVGQARVFLARVGARRPEWQRISVPATECARIDKRFLSEECKDEQKVLREYMCQFSDVEGRVFSEESIQAARIFRR